MLHLHSFTFNPFGENTWLLWTDSGSCMVIDPGCYGPEEEKTLESFILQNNLQPVRLVNTHCHIDHVLGNPFVFRTWGLKPEIHPLEQKLLDAVPEYGHMWGIRSQEQPEALPVLLPGTSLELDDETLEVLFTPGHSPGSVCLYSRKHAFLIGGDVLFRESIGRTDLPGGSYPQLEESIRTQLYSLPDATLVHPGHGPSTSIGFEKMYNPFVRALTV